jgi:ferredoxin-NADP reductase
VTSVEAARPPRAAIAYPLVLLTLTIRDVLPATPRARLVRLELNGTSFPYRAGQAVLVASHGRAPRKPYSVAAAPEDAVRDGWLELLVGVDADGSPGPHLELTEGSRVDVEGPVGRFVFPSAPRERRVVFIAGGTGIAPLRAMLRHALADPRLHVGLLYSARTPDEFAFEDELQAMARTGRLELRLTVTREAGPEEWSGTRGRIGRANLAPLVHDAATLCFVCGPPALVEEMSGLLRELGIPADRVRTEEWG